MSRLSKKDRDDALVVLNGPLIRRVLSALDKAEASESELRSRLSAARLFVYCPPTEDQQRKLSGITDLRVKNWRGDEA